MIRYITWEQGLFYLALAIILFFFSISIPTIVGVTVASHLIGVSIRNHTRINNQQKQLVEVQKQIRELQESLQIHHKLSISSINRLNSIDNKLNTLPQIRKLGKDADK